MRTPRGARLGRSAVLLAVVVTAAAGCGGGGEEGTSARPSGGSAQRSVEVTVEPTRTRSSQPTPSRTAEPTRAEPTRTEPTKTEPTKTEPTKTEPTRAEPTTTEPTADETTTRPATAVAAPPRTTAATAKPTPTQTASAAAAAVETEPVGPYGWLLVIGLLAMLGVGCLLVYRSQKRSAWDAEARAIEAETRTLTGVRLPPVLTTTTLAQRGLAWPPVRAGLADLAGRYDALAASALGESRRDWAAQLAALLRDLIAAVDAENEALTAGRDWRVLRPMVDQARRALAAVLAYQVPEPPPAGEPGPSAYQI